MRACHDGVDGSHFGRDKTLSKVSNKKDSVHKDVINVINPTVIFIGVTVILLEVNGKGCSRVLQMLRYLSESEQVHQAAPRVTSNSSV